MSGLVIDESRCVGCGRCVRACTSGGLVLEGRRVRVTESCTMCGVCVSGCKFGAITLEKDSSAGTDLTSYHDVWVFAQVDDGVIAPVSFELLGKGAELATARNCRLVALLGCDETCAGSIETLAGDLFAHGADEVVWCADARLANNNAEAYARWVCGLVSARKPEILLFGATSFGRELAPGVAASLRTGLTADCTVLTIDPATGLLHQTRPAFGGNLMATIMCPDHRPQMATVRPGVLAAPEADPTRTGTLTASLLDEGFEPRVRLVRSIPSLELDSVADAERLVVVGRGIGAQKNLQLMRAFAQAIGAKLGCTRPLVESGWCEYRYQVGQTGLAVAPKLLVSVGVSGAIQHLAGIGGAQQVVAINSDASAPIFGVSQYAVVGDCVEIVRELLDLLKKE